MSDQGDNTSKGMETGEWLAEGHKRFTVSGGHTIILVPSPFLHSTPLHTRLSLHSRGPLISFHPTPIFCLKLFTSVSRSSSKTCRNCPRNYNTSTGCIKLKHMKFATFVDQGWLVATSYVVQPDVFLTAGILCGYFSLQPFIILYLVLQQ